MRSTISATEFIKIECEHYVWATEAVPYVSRCANEINSVQNLELESFHYFDWNLHIYSQECWAGHLKENRVKEGWSSAEIKLRWLFWIYSTVLSRYSFRQLQSYFLCLLWIMITIGLVVIVLGLIHSESMWNLGDKKSSFYVVGSKKMRLR